jgi:hypothetical protein
MRSERGWILQGVCVAGGCVVLGAALLLSLFQGGEEPRSGMPPIFAAPSSLPEGEHWVLLGSKEALPEDAQVTAAQAGVRVLEVRRFSSKALGARIEVGGEASGPLLGVASELAATEAFPGLTFGEMVAPLSIDSNIGPEDFTGGQLLVPLNYLLYGYFEREDAPLSAVRIQNRATGEWTAHEYAESEAQAALEVPDPVDPKFFVDVDPHETLPDTNGDGVYDFDEPQEVREAVAAQLGVALLPGANTLDIVALDRSGRASWKTLEVFSTYSPPQEGGL